MKKIKNSVLITFLLIWMCPMSGIAQEISDKSDACMICHRAVTPGLVEDWERSLHAKVTPAEGMKKSKLESRVSAQQVADSLADFVVGCAECHTLLPDKHGDSFLHNGYNVHTVVSPMDCQICHPQEQAQYELNLMSDAHVNLSKNPTYELLIRSVNGMHWRSQDSIYIKEPDDPNNSQSCYYCHGTRVTVKEFAPSETQFGEMTFPVLLNWPNQGVGRINPDESRGSCSSCHARHSFSIQVAREPATCSECHKGPDVPAYKIYKVSKMGNLFTALHDDFDLNHVPWRIGTDFTAPTCATCHVSLVVDPDDNVLVRRSHRMNDRLSMRLFGLIYAHPHPRSSSTYHIQNKQGLYLPTELSGENVSSALIDEEEQNRRNLEMKKVCTGCHSRQWTDNHFIILDEVVEYSNGMTLTATQLMQYAWKEGLAKGLNTSANPFDEALERKWIETWLFYANSTRLSAAMAGADYGVFDRGRWHLSRTVQEMHTWIGVLSK